MRQLFASLAAVLVATISISFAQAQDHSHHGGEAGVIAAGELEISDAWVRAMLPNQPVGGGYLTITNNGSEPDRLIGASSPAAGKVEIHNMKMANDVMVMRPVEGGLEIAPGASVELAPGGLHVMFMEVTDRFDDGETVKVTLEFEKAGEVDVVFPVQAPSSGEHKH